MSRPLPPEIYRRRRIAVGLLALLVVVVVVLAVRAAFGGGDDTTSTSTSTPSPSPSESAEQVAPDGTVPVSLTTGTEPCDPTTVRITPSVPAEQAAGGDVSVVLTVSSTQAEGCVLDAEAADLVVVIDDGQAPVYDSTACPTSLLATPVTLSPEWATVTTVTWSGRVSGGTCGDAEAFVPGGDYTLKLGTLGGEPGAVSFSLAEAPPAPETPAPEIPETETPAPEATETPSG